MTPNMCCHDHEDNIALNNDIASFIGFVSICAAWTWSYIWDIGIFGYELNNF